MGEIVGQDLTIHSKINHRKNKNHHHNIRQKEFRRDPSNIRFYTWDDKGHYNIDCPRNRGFFKKKSNKKRHHVRTIEDSSSDEEYEFYW